MGEVDGILREVGFEAFERLFHAGIVGSEARPGARLDGPAEGPGDVAHVGQGAREVAVFDVEVEILPPPTLDRLDEVVVVVLVAAARPLAEHVPVVVEGHARGIVGSHDVALAAPPDVGHAQRPGRQVEVDRSLDFEAPDVGDEHRVVPLVDRDLAIGHVAIVDVAQPPPEAHDPRGERLLAEAPACLVELMGILVAKVAVAGAVVPVPVVMQLLADGDFGRGRSGPEVEVEAGRQGCGRVDQADARPALVAQRVGEFHRADLAARHKIDHLPHPRHAAALGPHLADPAELSRPVDHDPPLLHVVAAGLLDVDILAGLHRPHGHEGVPVVGGGDRDDIDVVPLEEAADVLFEDGLAGQFGEPLLVFRRSRRVAVAEGH